tara:strand:+ start:2683 stop:3687 length:1005 start_codon:yes stop_codon:yes gene_type:complete
MANGKRQAKISKEVVGAFQTLLHNLGVGRNLKKSAAKQLEKAKKYAKYKSILKPLIDFALSATLPIAGAGGALSKIARLSGASFSTDVLYDKLVGDILGMQADPSKIKAKGAVRYALEDERRMQKDLQESISKKLEDRILEASISGGSQWAMGKLTGLGKAKEGTEVVTKADKLQNFKDVQRIGYKGDQASWEALQASGEGIDLDEIISADKQSFKDAKSIGFKGTEDEWLAKTYGSNEVSLEVPGKEVGPRLDATGRPKGIPEHKVDSGFNTFEDVMEESLGGDIPIEKVHKYAPDIYKIFGWAPKSYYGYGGTLAALLAMGAGKKPEEDKRA